MHALGCQNAALQHQLASLQAQLKETLEGCQAEVNPHQQLRAASLRLEGLSRTASGSANLTCSKQYRELNLAKAHAVGATYDFSCHEEHMTSVYQLASTLHTSGQGLVADSASRQRPHVV